MDDKTGLMERLSENHPLVSVIALSIISIIGIAAIVLTSTAAMSMFGDLSQRLI